MGWPKGMKRGPRKPRVEETTVIHEPMREAAKPIRAAAGAVDMSQWDDFEYEPSDGVDRLKVPKEIIPDGMDYQWVTDSVLGQPMPQRRAEFERTGWRPVPAERHDGLYTPRGHKGEIRVDAAVLMERPLKYSLKARQLDERRAFHQVYAKEQQIRGGDIKGISDAFDTQHQSALQTNKVGKSYEPIPIPEK